MRHSHGIVSVPLGYFVGKHGRGHMAHLVNGRGTVALCGVSIALTIDSEAWCGARCARCWTARPRTHGPRR